MQNINHRKALFSEHRTLLDKMMTARVFVALNSTLPIFEIPEKQQQNNNNKKKKKKKNKIKINKTTTTTKKNKQRNNYL